MQNRIKKSFIALLVIYLSLAVMSPFLVQAVDYTKTQTKYGRHLTTMGVKAVALFNSDTGKFSSHGKETKYGERTDIFIVSQITVESKTNTTYSAMSSFKLSEYHVFGQTTTVEFLDFTINSDGSW